MYIIIKPLTSLIFPSVFTLLPTLHKSYYRQFRIDTRPPPRNLVKFNSLESPVQHRLFFQAWIKTNTTSEDAGACSLQNCLDIRVWKRRLRPRPHASMFYPVVYQSIIHASRFGRVRQFIFPISIPFRPCNLGWCGDTKPAIATPASPRDFFFIAATARQIIARSPTSSLGLHLPLRTH
jgi:hypothetical protein